MLSDRVKRHLGTARTPGLWSAQISIDRPRKVSRYCHPVRLPTRPGPRFAR